jgi:hypothetical protein
MTNWRWFSSSSPSAAPICCMAGSMMSMASALIAISAAASAMNSPRGSAGGMPARPAAWSGPSICVPGCGSRRNRPAQ